MLKDILQDWDDASEGYLKEGQLNWLLSDKGKRCINKRFATINGDKAQCLTARSIPSWNCQYIHENNKYRHLTAIECERLQTLPDNYTFVDGMLTTHRYKALGNAWTVDVIAHIFKHINS